MLFIWDLTYRQELPQVSVSHDCSLQDEEPQCLNCRKKLETKKSNKPGNNSDHFLTISTLAFEGLIVFELRSNHQIRLVAQVQTTARKAVSFCSPGTCSALYVYSSYIRSVSKHKMYKPHFKTEIRYKRESSSAPGWSVARIRTPISQAFIAA